MKIIILVSCAGTHGRFSKGREYNIDYELAKDMIKHKLAKSVTEPETATAELLDKVETATAKPAIEPETAKPEAETASKVSEQTSIKEATNGMGTKIINGAGKRTRKFTRSKKSS